MKDCDLTSVGRVLIGSRITVAGTITGIMFPEVRTVRIPFLLLAAAVLAVVSTVRIVSSMRRSPLPL